MGSKRPKKIKQNEEVLTENDLNNGNENEKILNENIIKDQESLSNENETKPPVKSSKRKKKTDVDSESVPMPKKARKIAGNNDVRVRKRKTKENVGVATQATVNGIIPKSEETIKQEPVEIKTEDGTPEKKQIFKITWPDSDIAELINRMEINIPEQDSLAYKSRLEKINWNDIAFKEYSPDDCKQTWSLVQKRIRRFRLLKEILNDAKVWLHRPKPTNNKLPKPKRHPDMPRRPLSSYLLFYLKNKAEIISANPGLGSGVTKKVGEVYKNLPAETREKYEKLAADNRADYLKKMQIFFEKYPEFRPVKRMKNHTTVKLEPKVEAPTIPKPKVKVTKDKKVKKVVKKVQAIKKEPVERPPKKNQTPFAIFLAAELKTMEPGTDKVAFRERCKLAYKEMSDELKVEWFNLAELDLIRFQEEEKAYKLRFPNYKTQKVTSALTKHDKRSRERASGKPMKPPSSAYTLFSKELLQSAEVKNIQARDRMNYCAAKWKSYTSEQQEKYKQQVAKGMAKYREAYNAYLDTLPEDERRKLVKKRKRKTRIAPTAPPAPIRKKRGRKGRPPKKGSQSAKPKLPEPARKLTEPEPKFTEPEQPPISACKYFAKVFKGDGDPLQAWKSLSSEEKKKYEDELVKKKQAYIIEFERFLKSLSKDELEAFSKSRQEQAQSDGETSDCSSNSENEDEDEEKNESDSE